MMVMPTIFIPVKNGFILVLALIYAADVIDTYIKGRDYVANLHWEYPVRNTLHILLCVVAIRTDNRKFHATTGYSFSALPILVDT
jgi:hypothetical protein